MKEKAFVLMQRVLWSIALVLCFVIPFIIILATPTKTAEIVDENCYLIDYYESLDQTSCEVEIICSCNVDSTYITVAFYDESGKLLATEESYFYSSSNTLTSTFYSIDGKVDSFEIIDANVSASDDIFPSYSVIVFFIVLIVVIAFFISSLMLSCKTYNYNGNKIVAYAGWYHHYIKINGEKYDEHNTLHSFSPIYLSCMLDETTIIEATVTSSNRIALKINGKLQKPTP